MTALDELTALFPPPHGRNDDTIFDWTATAQRLGVTALPTDFSELLDTYGDVRFCNALRLFRPSTHPGLDLAEVTVSTRELLADNDIGVPPTQVPTGVSVDPAHLIQWGGSFGGDYCLWDAHDPDPQTWTLIFADVDRYDWGYYPGSVTEYLLDWLTGQVAPIPLWNLDAVLPPGTAPFAELYDPTDPTDTALARIDIRS